MRFAKTFIVVLITGLYLSACSSEEAPEQAQLNEDQQLIVANAGETVIDWHQVWRSFHLEPRWQRGLSKEAAFANQLNYLIDQKLYASEARKAGLDKTAEVMGQLDFITQKEMLKALYAEEVASNVEISDAEYQEAYVKLKKRVKLAYIATPNKERAATYQSLLSSKSHDQIVLVNPSEDEVGVTPFFSLGDMEERLEKAAFSLALNDVSEPIRIEGKYRIVKLIDSERDLFMSEMDLAEKKSKIHKVLFNRKARKFSDKILFDVLKDKDIDIQRETFFALLSHLEEIVENKESDDAMPVYLTNPEIKKTLQSSGDLKNKVLVEFRGGEMTVGSFMQDLLNRPTGLRPQVNMAAPLKKAIAVAVRDHELLKLAYERNLQDSPTVRYEVALQSDQLLARYWLKEQRKNHSVPQTALASFAESDRLNTLKKQFGDKLDKAAIKNIQADYFFTQKRMALSDSLRNVYQVKMDSALVLQKIGDPETILDKNQIDFVFRENY